MLGEDLKKRREELGLSLTEVSLVTKISLRVLHAIEAMDRSQLPAEIFLKGLLKSYALHLKMDADTVMKGYLAQLNPAPVKPVVPVTEEPQTMAVEAATPAPTPKPKVEHVEEVKEKPAHSSSVQKPVKIGWVVAIIAVVVVGAVTAKFVVDHSQSNAPITMTPKEEDKTKDVAMIPIIPSNSAAPVDSAGVVAPNVPAPAPMPVPVHPVTAAAEPVPVQPQPKIEEPVKEQPAVTAQVPTTPPPAAAVAPATPPPAAQPVVEKPVAKVEPPPAPTPTQAAVVKPEEKPKEPEKKPAAVVAGKKQVILEALDKVNIVIKKGSKQYKISLQPDEIHTVQYSDTIEVEVSDGGAVNIIQNGHDNGVAGDLGKPKKISL